jgi:hypothetical protein
VCKPREFGGLGVKNLHLKGLALRVRWEWVPRIDESRSWQGLPVIKDVEARDAFDSLVRITVGEGHKILFWRDRWIGGRSAHDIAPGITLHVKTRIKNSRTVAQAMNQNAWINDISGNLATLERGSALRYVWLCTTCQGTMLNRTSSPGRGLCLVPTQPDQPTLCCRRELSGSNFTKLSGRPKPLPKANSLCGSRFST